MTNQTDARREQARGNGVAQAGQFGHQAHSAPGAFDAGIDDTAEETQTASVALDVQLNCFGVPSSRHRNAQWFKVPGVLSVDAPIVASEDAPRVLTIAPKEGGRRQPEQTYTIYDGQLYRPTGSDLETAVRNRGDVIGPRWGEPSNSLPTVDEAGLEAIQHDIADNWIVVDGVVHERVAEEPLLVVRSWGVEVETSYRAGIDERGFITDRDVYTLDEWERAQAASERRRKRKGGDDLGMSIDAGEGLSEFRSGYRRPPKLDYSSTWPGFGERERDRSSSAAELVKMRAGMAQVPGAVTRVDDGFGGTRPSIDWNLFSARQENDYRQLARYAEER